MLSSFKNKSLGAQGRALFFNCGNFCWLTDWMEELLGAQWNRTTMFIKRVRKRPWGSCPSTSWQDTKYFTKRNLTAGESRCLQSEPVQNWREIKAGRKLDFPKFQKGGVSKEEARGEGEREAEIDLRLEINILHQQIAVVLCFNNLMGKKRPSINWTHASSRGEIISCWEGRTKYSVHGLHSPRNKSSCQEKS